MPIFPTSEPLAHRGQGSAVALDVLGSRTRSPPPTGHSRPRVVRNGDGHPLWQAQCR
jgi:hypothetical protein